MLSLETGDVYLCLYFPEAVSAHPVPQPSPAQPPQSSPGVSLRPLPARPGLAASPQAQQGRPVLLPVRSEVQAGQNISLEQREGPTRGETQETGSE